jgi:hypothetical protein
MNVRALHIIDWADSREAQDQLPALVRRLIHATAEVESIFFPSGESVSRPGVDGMLDAKGAAPWVPGGKSVWEMGCDQSPGAKATRDYEGRRDEADAGTSFVFVTPRRWRGKQEWATSKQAEGLWRDVILLDADDLEQWIERAPGVGIWLSEKLGIAGPGLHSPDHWWDRWSGQTRHAITAAAIFTGRDTAQAELVRHLQSETPFVGIRGDSAEEAAAFACATLIDVQLADRAAIVSDVDAYRWIDANPGLSFVIAATPEIGSEWRPRDGVKLIVPSNPSRAGRTGDETRSDVSLPRILRHDFEQALVELGHDPADAARLSRNTGRSWSIYRRVEARNPALAHPAWLDRPAARSLTTLCLVGAWISSESGDTAIVERIAGRAYADIERELRELANIDDSPILRIGDVWMALSPIELLHLVGPRITSDELDRFYEALETIFSERDPVLDIAADQRWSAAIYGKKRTASGLVIDGMGDSLVKLSVVGDVMEALTPARPSGRAALLVRRLLSNADRDRWLSLANVLRELAEAAPEEYLLQLEAGIRSGDDGPAALIRETGRAGPSGGGCWHADLLWSLELLAWSPRRLVKVASLLAALSDTPVAGNWANTPMAALVSLFRPWWPQTAADERARITAIDRVIERYPEQCWTLLNDLSTGGGSFASPNAHPQWRTDDLGHTRPLKARSFNYERAIRTRTIALAGNRADRLADLLRELRSYHGKDQVAILDQADAFIDNSDADREVLRAALRKYLWWEHSFNGTHEHGVQPHLDRAEQIYHLLAPEDLIVRHAWLFAADWIEPPEGNSFDDDGEALADRLRKSALAEIMDQLGGAAVMALARASAQPHLVGRTLGKYPEFEIDTAALLPLIEEPDTDSADVLLLRGYFNGLTDERLAALVASLETMPEIANSDGNFISLLLRLPPGPPVWERADQASAEVRGAYWRQMFPRPGRQPEDTQFVLGRLMEFERPRTALALAQFKPGEADPDLLLDMLSAFGSGQEPDGPMLDYWRVDRIIKVLEENEVVDRIQLATMEWALYPLLKHGRETPKVLAEQLVNHAELFTQLIEIAFPKASDDADPADSNDEASNAAARERSHNAYWLLQSLNMLPGTDRGGRIEASRFRSWVEAIRQYFRGGDQAKLADDLIGAMLAHSPDGTDGHWPHELVREVIELPDADVIREGFLVGVRNKRGVTTRAYNEGGDQERRLSAKYEARAAAIADAWPETAELLRKLADAYKREADREDEDARLRIER